MEIEPRLWAVILIGPPGAGKDTQAGLLALELGLEEVKTSRIIEEKFTQADPNDLEIQKAIEKKNSGSLVEPDLVQKWVIEKINEVHKEGKGLVTSGSPRTVSEAQAEVPLLKDLYGPENLKIVYIQISEAESVKRNSARRICEANGHPIPNLPEYVGLTTCPQDSSKIISRSDDNPETIKHRYQVYKTETEPVIDFLKKEGYNIITIEGEKPIEDVHRDILNQLW